MKYTGPQITTLLRENLRVPVGRHLYAVLGAYAQLEQFERETLCQMTLPDGRKCPQALNLNRALMDRLGDADLRSLVRSEAKRPQAVQRRLNLELDALLAGCLEHEHFLALKQIELVFAYQLDLQTLRARASNQNHILLLLPGEVRGDHVTLFTEAGARFQRELPGQLIAENHLWELADAAIA